MPTKPNPETPPAGTGTPPLPAPHERAVEQWKKLDQLQKAKASFVAALLCGALFIVLLIAHVATVSTSASTPRLSAIVFTDGADDDFLALNYLAHRSDISVSHVVVTGTGRTSPTAAFRNVEGFYRLVNQAGAQARHVPTLLRGSAHPMNSTSSRRGYNPTSAFRHDALFGSATAQEALAAAARRRFSPSAGRRYVEDYLTPLRQAGIAPGRRPLQFTSSSAAEEGDENSALPALHKRLTTSPDDSVVVLALAPLTDVAQLLVTHRSLFHQKVHAVVVSGGTVSAPGDIGQYFFSNQKAELNFFLDPVAAHEVLSMTKPPPGEALGKHEVRVTVAPLDAALQSPYTAAWRMLTSSSRGTDVDRWIAQVLSASYATTSPQSAFASRGLPRDLVAASLLASPSFRAASSAVRAPIGVVAHPSKLELAGVMGTVGGANATEVSVVASTSPGVLWSEYERVTNAPWPL